MYRTFLRPRSSDFKPDPFFNIQKTHDRSFSLFVLGAGGAALAANLITGWKSRRGGCAGSRLDGASLDHCVGPRAGGSADEEEPAAANGDWDIHGPRACGPQAFRGRRFQIGPRAIWHEAVYPQHLPFKCHIGCSAARFDLQEWHLPFSNQRGCHQSN